MKQIGELVMCALPSIAWAAAFADSMYSVDVVWFLWISAVLWTCFYVRYLSAAKSGIHRHSSLESRFTFMCTGAIGMIWTEYASKYIIVGHMHKFIGTPHFVVAILCMGAIRQFSLLMALDAVVRPEDYRDLVDNRISAPGVV